MGAVDREGYSEICFTAEDRAVSEYGKQAYEGGRSGSFCPIAYLRLLRL